jgi:hypothetical protein
MTAAQGLHGQSGVPAAPGRSPSTESPVPLPGAPFKCRAATLAVAVGWLILGPASLVAAQVRVGPVLGASLIEQRDTSLSHGPLDDEITVGRTILVGAVIDFKLTDHDHIDAEVTFGPYHNDVERSCVSPIEPCTPAPFKSVSWGMHYGMQYVRTFSERTWRPYAAAGLGVKSYVYEEPFETENASPTLSLAVGVEQQRRPAVRFEFRTIVVRDNPLLLGKTQVELQARAALLLGR